MEKMKISVIIPVYNGEKHILRSVESVLNQTHRNTELIAVDDGSSDGTSALLDGVAAKNPAVTVIHKANGGVSSARNAGLSAAAGDYVFFLDADDYIEPQALESMVSASRENGADITACTLRLVKNGKPLPSPSQEVSGLYEGDALQELYKMLCRGKPDACVTMCNKLYRRSLIADNGIAFPPLVSGEDTLFAFECCLAAKRIFFMDGAVFYNYVMNDTSFSHSEIPIKTRVAQSDMFFSALEKKTKEYFQSSAHLAEYLRCIEERKTVSLYSFAATACRGNRERRLRDIEYIASLENYRTALSPEVYSGFPARYRLIMRLLSRGNYKAVIRIMSLIRTIKGD